jgi:subtilisin family serine protease
MVILAFVNILNTNNMKQIIILTFFSLLVFRGLNSFAQEVSFYVQIEDSGLIPEITKEEKTNNLVFKSKDIVLDAILKKYKISKFDQAFPTIPVTSWLSKVYMVKCNKKDLGEELKEIFKEKIPLVEYLSDPELTYTPNDYGLALGQTNLDLIHSKEAWDICKDLPKINIAISDTYFDLTHEDLSFIGYQGSNNPNVADAYHGTFVAGCIAAITDNNKGLSSVGYNSKLYASTNRTDNEVLLLAQAGYRVINCSWLNSYTYSSTQNTLYALIRNTYNTVVVCGAGNKTFKDVFNVWHYAYEPVYPASYPANISVTSIGHIYNYGTQGTPSNNWKDVHDEIIGDSTSSHHHNAQVDICAPGYNVSTTDIMGAGGNSTGNYGSGWGTSFAAPQVSATMGLIFSVNPCLTADQGVAILLNNTDNSVYSIPENSRYIGKLGTGRLNVFAAVNAAAESATRYLQNQTLSGTQTVKANYAIRATGNVTVPSGANVNFITRKEVTLNGPFEVVIGAIFSVDVNVNNLISCN